MVTLVPVSGLDDSHRDLFAGYVEVYAASGRALFGEDHTAWGADELRSSSASTTVEPWPSRRWSATARWSVPPPSSSACATTRGRRSCRWPCTRGTAAAAGSRLLAWVEEQARQGGRTVFIAETEWPTDGTDNSGEGFAARHGYRPAQRSSAARSGCLWTSDPHRPRRGRR